MDDVFGPRDRLLGVASGITVALLCVAYVVVLALGLLLLPSPDQQIQQPWFFLMEVLILGIAPAMVSVSIAIHAWAATADKSLALAGVVFMSMSAALTCAVHFCILAIGSQPAFASDPWVHRVFSFEWPSVAYGLDILAWDFFFPLGAWFAGLAVQGEGLQRKIRLALFASAALALLGLLGVPLDNMQVRNVGIVGYALVFPVACGLLAALFHRTRSQP
ncbi:MAG: hypothetical protein KA164_06665 [Rhodoferax sp.]|jgi:hypothetical protein|nr:hypothetical protein [Rhodoferax sp.]